MKYLLFAIAFSISVGLNGQVEQIVQSIAQNGKLSFDEGVQMNNFLKLLDHASIDELVVLTDHQSPAVRGFAFWGLAKKNYADLESIFINHLDDKAKVHVSNGCMFGDNSVIEFMRQVVTPYMYDLECKKLSDEVRAMIK